MDSKANEKTNKSLKALIAERRREAQNLKNKPIQLGIMDPYEAVNRLAHSFPQETGFIEQESPGHYCLWDEKYPEYPLRVSVPRKRLEALKLIDRCTKIQSEKISDDIIFLKHTRQLLEQLKLSSTLNEDKLEWYSSKWDSVYFSQETYRDAILAAEAAITLTCKVAAGELKNGFALVRPPGHHAMTNDFCGYCFLNNVALAAEVAISRGLSKRVLIVDYDVHHGQGTQRMFYDRNDVFYFSIHRYEHGEFWPNLRESDSDYIGSGQGKGYTLNVPLNETEMNDIDYLAIVLNLLLPVAYEFNPDLILISAGYDAAIGCPEGRMNISPHFYSHLISLLSGLANGRIVVCLEGGYFLESLAEGVACTLKTLLGDFCHPLGLNPNLIVKDSLQEVINNVKFFLRDYWECFKYEPFFEFPKSDNSLNFDKQVEHVTCLSYNFTPVVITEFETRGFYPVRSEEETIKFNEIIVNFRKEYSNNRKCPYTIGYVYNDEFLQHKPTLDSGNSAPEKPERLAEIINCLKKFSLIQRCKLIQSSEINPKLWLEKIHKCSYVESLYNLETSEERRDWYYNEHTVKCVEKCISSILSLAKSIHNDEICAGVALIRPPGHHAAFDSGSGFCFANNVVIAAEYLIELGKYDRILIVDFDIHHGNGTQSLTYDRADIMYISVHRFDNGKCFPSKVEANYDYIGDNSGKGFNINIPFNKGTKSNVDYWMVWHKLVIPLAYSYNPQFVIISAGFDAGIYDPLGGGYKITPEMFGHFVQTLKNLASGKLLLALEGGYNLETTSLSMMACIKALLGDPLPSVRFDEKITEDTLETIQKVIDTHKHQWKMLQVNKKIANFCCTKIEMEELLDLARNANENSSVKFQEIINNCKKT